MLQVMVGRAKGIEMSEPAAGGITPQGQYIRAVTDAAQTARVTVGQARTVISAFLAGLEQANPTHEEIIAWPALWTCKIGGVDRIDIPKGADSPMREAVSEEYYRLTGSYPDFIFSGWGGQLREVERAAHEKRMPNDRVLLAERMREAHLMSYTAERLRL